MWKASVENENGGLKRRQMKAPLVLSESQSGAFEGPDWQRGVWNWASKACYWERESAAAASPEEQLQHQSQAAGHKPITLN